MNSRSGSLTVLLLFACVGSGCSSAPLSQTFVGKTDDSNFYIGVVDDGTQVFAYVCDGDTTSESFVADLSQGQLQVTSRNDAELSATISADLAIGVVRLQDGAELEFSVPRTDNISAGVFLAERTIDSVQVWGKWVVLPDGSQRGLILGDEILGTATLDLETLSASHPNLGDFQACRLGDDGCTYP